MLVSDTPTTALSIDQQAALLWSSRAYPRGLDYSGRG